MCHQKMSMFYLHSILKIRWTDDVIDQHHRSLTGVVRELVCNYHSEHQTRKVWPSMTFKFGKILHIGRLTWETSSFKDRGTP